MGLMLLITGCDNKNDITNEDAKNSTKSQELIPFLTYYNESNNSITAKLTYWDLNNAKIDFTDKVVYTAKPTEYFDAVEPIMWAGNRKIVLYKNSTPSAEFKENAKVVINSAFDTAYGRNIEAKRNLDNNKIEIQRKVKDYTLYLYGEKGVIEKNVAFLFKTKDKNNNDIIVGENDFPSFVGYDNKTGEITLIFQYPFDEQINLYVARCNVDDIEKINWDEIKLSKEIKTGGNYTPCLNNSALIGSKYYIRSQLSFAEVDLEKKESKTLGSVNSDCRSVIKEGSFNPGYPKDIIPVGTYEDVLILSVPVSTDKSIEYLLCSFKSNEFQGAIHLKSDDTWDIIDKNKQVVSKINIKDKNLFKMFNSCFLCFPTLGKIA